MLKAMERTPISKSMTEGYEITWTRFSIVTEITNEFECMTDLGGTMNQSQGLIN